MVMEDSMINTKIDCGNLNPEGQEMGGIWDTIVSKINTPATKAKVQAEIEKNKQKAIDAAIATASKAAGKLLTKAGATDPKSLAAISKVTEAMTQGAQASLWETHKKKVYIGAGILAVGVGALIFMKMRKKA